MSRKVLLVTSVLALVGLFGAAVAAAGPSSQVGGNGRGPASLDESADQVVIFMTARGERQGLIQGSVSQAGVEDWMEVVGYSHEIVSPRDAASGLPTGKRQHKPLVVTKPVDKATPLLYNALVSAENLTDVTLEFYEQHPRTGRLQHYFTIELQNASIEGIASGRPADEAHEPREHVSFTYQKIEWTWEDGGITAEDDWETPGS
ncbi:MAG: Hcp family type VI secretion system effector [Dehalococcoidia bacterium]